MRIIADIAHREVILLADRDPALGGAEVIDIMSLAEWFSCREQWDHKLISNTDPATDSPDGRYMS